ncbi:MAG: dimethylmenaquinone methyltransferase [Firmicutes bacterium]|nr:dimethylmenaquinone methyltransferase [Bacillota bacterium]
MRRRFLKVAAASVYDALDAMGYANQCLSLEIKPVTPTCHIAGPAFTIRGSREPRYDDDLKRPQFEDFGLFKAMYDGCIIVINAEVDRYCGHWGEMMSYSARQHGAKGVVIDGGTRDREGLIAIPDWPVFARYTTPIESKKRWRPLEFQVPIYVTGTLTSQVRVNPGDWIVGDPDGVIVIPKEIAYEVLLAVEKIEINEEGTRRELAAGVPVAEVYRKYGRM